MSKAASHRTYPPLTMKKGGETSYFPVGHFEARQKVFTKAGARRAWVLNGRKELEPVVILVRKEQNFASQATQFELDFSKLVALQNTADPVTTEEGEVVGHLGWFQGGRHLLVPNGVGTNITTPLKDTLQLDVSVFVASRNSIPSHYNLYGVTDEGFRLLTTIDGLVLAQLGYRTRDGAESVWYSPVDFIAVGKVLTAIAKSGGRIAINALGRRGSRRLEALGLSKKAAEDSAGAVAKAAAAQADEAPAVARALRTQVNLQGHKIERTVQLIEQPTVFRHTITADVPMSSFAQIEKEGALRLSNGAKAHYGEGVYVWPKGGTTHGRYIDIEIAPGNAAELIKAPSGTWYRIVPPQGNKVGVKIVGHNFTADEVKMGRMLVGG